MIGSTGWLARVFASLLITLSALAALGQSPVQPTEVKGLPTNEVFDLLVDRKGFLWVGHDMGISRFDGVSFSHFSHPKRSSLSVTDMVEDPQGRIWFHNFTGQVFYIENERVNLLEAYKNEAEDFFPRLVLCDGQVVVTSKYGLFVCDTRTMESRYIRCSNAGESGTKSLAVVGNNVVACDLNQWFLYNKKDGLVKIPIFGRVPIPMAAKSFALQAQSFRDTIFLVTNPPGSVYKLLLRGRQLHVQEALEIGRFINGVQALDQQVWLHTQAQSSVLGEKTKEPVLEGFNISDRVRDHLGNHWISSLTKGLLVATNNNYISRPFFTSFTGKEPLSGMGVAGDTLLLGTKNGHLYLVDALRKKLIWQHRLPADRGSVSMISDPIDGKFIISTSTQSFFLDYRTRSISPYSRFIIKEVVPIAGKLVLAASTGLFATPMDNLEAGVPQLKIFDLKDWNKKWQQFNQAAAIQQQTLWNPQRSRSVVYHPEKQRLLASFMNGVFELDQAGVRPLMIEGEKVYSNSMLNWNGKIYIGTLNKGLFILDGKKIKALNAGSGLFSNSIVRLKKTGPYIWLLQDRNMQLLDPRTDKIVSDIELPQEPGSHIQDVDNRGDTAYLTTPSSVYAVLMKPSPHYQQLQSFLNLIVINQKDTIEAATTTLKHFQNDIQFQLSVPWYNPANNLYFKYRLRGEANDTRWYSSVSGERAIRFASLMPGEYTFESYAVVAGFQEKTPVVYSFIITKPWYKTVAFNLLLTALAAFVFYVVYRMRVKQVLRLEQVRRSISSDLHDEIGSTISSINIYSELAKSEVNNEPYLELIQENTRDVISKLDDLVWSINPKNDSVEQLIARMRSFAEPVLLGAGIQPHFQVEDSLRQLELPLATKRNLYLVFKELINNVVKHSKARNCYVELTLHQNQLQLSVLDDGIGIGKTHQRKGRSGMSNLMDRSKQMKGNLSISRMDQGGTKAQVHVPVK